MEVIELILRVWTFFALVSGTLAAPVVILGRRRVHWKLWDLSVILLPITLWTLLMGSPLSTGTKTLANFGEPLYFLPAASVAALVRVAVGQRVPEWIVRIGVLVAACAAAVSVFFLTPSWPE